MGMIPCAEENLKAREPNLDAIKKTGTSYDLYLSAAETQIAADMMNRQQPVKLEWLANPSQLTPAKVYLTLGMIYRGGSKAKGDRHWELADMYENKYGAELGALVLTLSDGARVRRRQRVMRGS